MTLDLDDLPFEPDDTADHRVVVLEREPRKCRRHRWTFFPEPKPGDHDYGLGHAGWFCANCLRPKDAVASRRGKSARNRGNAFEREVAAKLGGRRVGQYGDQVDVDVPGYLRVQTKNGGTYPRTIDRWLRAIPVEAGLLRAVVLGDAPGPGTRRRTLIVFDLDEYAMWHGRSK